MSEFESILVTTDFSEAALPGVAAAASLARSLGSRTIVLYVVEDHLPPLLLGAGPEPREAILRDHQERAEAHLAQYAERHLAGLRVECRVTVGVPWARIVETAEDEGVDLIVLATHGYGPVGRALFGSTALRVLDHAPCPVMTVRSRQP